MRIEYNSDGRPRVGNAMEDCYALTLRRIADGHDTAETRSLLNDAARAIGKTSASIEADIRAAKATAKPNLARALALQAKAAA